MEESPFSSLHIDSAACLDEVSGRSKCPQCQRSRKYYCYTCYIAVPEVASQIPNVKLPIKVDVIKHPSEVDGKSTAVHAAVIAPDDVTIYTYPCIPDYKDKDKVVLVFPGDNSVSLEQLAEKWKSASNGGNSAMNAAGDLINKSGICKRKADSEPTDIMANKTLKMQKSEEGIGDDTDLATDNLVQISTGEQQSGKITVKTRTGEQQSGETTVKTNSLQCDRTDDEDKHVECIKSLKEETSCLNQQANCQGSSENQEQAESAALLDEKKTGLVPDLPFERVVFVDSTWNQTRSICGDERLRGLACIELKSRETRFWRHQHDIPNTYLSTIEAMYYFMCDFHSNFIQTPYAGEYDNMLFFFSFMYNKIRSLYNGGDELQAYKKRKGNKQKKSEMT